MKIKIIIVLLFVQLNSFATIWQVGPTKTYTYCSQVAPLVQNGDTIQIDNALYQNDPQVQWNKNDLFITGVGGRPRLEAGSIIANDMVNGKGIFVISGSNVRVENIEFANATVQDHNGAGIRQEGANLYITHCKFDGNEMGILCGNIANCKTTIEYSEFLNGGSILNPGYQHNIYINHIDTFIFRYNYSHEAIAEGHELKSRATNNFILYNRIANETSVDSRTIDLPNGGTSVVVGNVIEQGINSANSNLLGYGLEGLTNPGPHNVWISNNTFVNKKTTGSFINVAAGTDTLFVKSNILAGAKTGGLIIGTAAVLDSSNNLIDDSPAVFGFVNINLYDYHLMPGSIAIDAGVTLTKTIYGYPLQPQYMYKDSCNMEVRPSWGTTDVGAFEYLLTSGIDEKDLQFSGIYPNPCTDILYMQRATTYKVTDVSGKTVLTGKGKSIDTKAIAPGVYFLQTSTDYFRFVKSDPQ